MGTAEISLFIEHIYDTIDHQQKMVYETRPFKRQIPMQNNVAFIPSAK